MMICMHNWLSRFMSLFLLSVTMIIVTTSVMQKTATAQIAPFLISPYYGTEVVTQSYSTGHPAIDFGLSYERILASADGYVNTV